MGEGEMPKRMIVLVDEQKKVVKAGLFKEATKIEIEEHKYYLLWFAKIGKFSFTLEIWPDAFVRQAPAAMNCSVAGDLEFL